MDTVFLRILTETTKALAVDRLVKPVALTEAICLPGRSQLSTKSAERSFITTIVLNLTFSFSPIDIHDDIATRSTRGISIIPTKRSSLHVFWDACCVL